MTIDFAETSMIYDNLMVSNPVNGVDSEIPFESAHSSIPHMESKILEEGFIEQHMSQDSFKRTVSPQVSSPVITGFTSPIRDFSMVFYIYYPFTYFNRLETLLLLFQNVHSIILHLVSMMHFWMIVCMIFKRS